MPKDISRDFPGQEIDVFEVIEKNRETGVERVVGTFPNEPSAGMVKDLPTECPHEHKHCKRTIRRVKRWVGTN